MNIIAENVGQVSDLSYGDHCPVFLLPQPLYWTCSGALEPEFFLPPKRASDYVHAVGVEFVRIKVVVGVGQAHGVEDYISPRGWYFCLFDGCVRSVYI